eukprot:11162865-Lingulodinium_polyedra.AAC.1
MGAAPALPPDAGLLRACRSQHPRGRQGGRRRGIGHGCVEPEQRSAEAGGLATRPKGDRSND